MSDHATQGPPVQGPPGSAGLPAIDVNEYGGKTKEGERQVSTRRLFMQLLCFGVPPEKAPSDVVRALGHELDQRGVEGVVYEDVNDPLGIALLTWSEDPAHFVTRVRPILGEPALRSLHLKPEYTMMGRTYSSGHEPKLAWWLLDKPRENATNPAWPWAVWYPLRRTGAFARLTPEEQSTILREHATIGFAYGQQDLAHDIRLACHGIDARDNEFVIGLVGRELHPLSHLVQAMRKTKQTSEYISQMGPFFVGRVAHTTRR